MGKWEMVRLGDVFKIASGGTPAKNRLDYYNKGTIPWVKTGDLKEKYINSEYVERITDLGLANSSAKLFPSDTVLIAMYGATIGATSILNFEACTNQACAAFLPSQSIQSEFLYYFLLSQKANFIKLGVGGAQPNISVTILKEVKMPFPPLDEQKRIAKNLDLASDIVKGYKKQVTELDKLVQSVFYEMFGDPVTNEKGWAIGTIRDVVREVKYGTSRPATEGGKYPYLRMNNITSSGHLDLSNLKQIDIPDNELEKCMVTYGDVLFNRTNSKELVGKTCVYNLQTRMIIAGYIIRVRVNEKMIPEFLSAILNSKYGKNTLYGMCKSIIGQANINAQELQSIRIYVPPIQLQTRFASIVTEIEAQKAQIQQALTEAENLFNSLMQEYFE